MHPLRNPRPALPALLALLLSACATTQPVPLASIETFPVDDLSRDAQVERMNELSLAVTVVPRERAKALFGVDLGSRWVHALWVDLDNRRSHHPHWLLLPSLAPGYLSPAEVAYRFRVGLSQADYDTLVARLEAGNFHNPVHAGQRRRGFVFVSTDSLDREAAAIVIGRHDLLELPIFLPRPELLTDKLPDARSLYPTGAIEKLSLEALRNRLPAVGCCTTDAKQRASGDPLNLVIIARPKDLRRVFTSRGWHPAEKNHAESIRKTIASFLFGSRYDYSPVSPLYAFGRKQDLAMQKARASINQRNHLRLWLTPWSVGDKPVWIGQISRDIGVRFTLKSPFLVTHKIDPDIDEARNYLIEDLLLSGQIEAFGYIEGLGASSPDKPRHNLTGDPYWSDGLRAILVVDHGKLPTRRVLQRREIRFLDWDHGALHPDQAPRHIDPTAVRH